MTDPARACHDLLLQLAGRLPNRVLWRQRDWLAAGAHPALARTLPQALLRHRVGVTDDERELLRAALLPWGAGERALVAVRYAAEHPQPAVGFSAGPDGGWDTADLVLAAVAGATGGVGELHRAWRSDGARVVLVSAAQRLPELTATLQRVLRAHGQADPCVEVFASDSPLTPYHRAALDAGQRLWRLAAAPAAPEPVPLGVGA